MDDKINNLVSGSPLPSSQIAPPASLSLVNSDQNISPLPAHAEVGPCLSSTSSPKVPIYTNNGSNHLANDQQRCSPSVSNSSLKRVLSRSGTPSSSNASLHLKIGTPKSAAGDVYEFQSSPEEDPVPASGPGFFFASVPNNGVFHPKSATAIQQNIVVENHQPPLKRIKTAILAKKLLAAAADSNIIESVALTQTNGNDTTLRKTTAFDKFGSESVPVLEGTHRETEGGFGEGLFEEDEEEAEEQEEGELDDQGQQDGERLDASASVVVQEQKKVPPLRISLLKTPSEEGSDASSAQNSPSLRKNRGGSRVGGRRQEGYGSKREELQRITRSRVRQIAADPNGADGISLLGRKRRFRPVMAGGCGLLEEEEDGDATSGAAEATENAGEDDQRSRNNEDQRSEEDSRHSATGGNRTTDGGGEANAEDAPSQQRPSLAVSVLSKNSLEQSVTFEAMIRERWALQYKEYLRNITERMESADLGSQHQQEPQEVLEETNLFGTDVTNEWPELLQKLYSEQANRSREMAEAHRQDRERILTMMHREMARVAKTAGQRQTHFITAVSMLRDLECYDPSVFAEGVTSAGRSLHAPSLAQIQQRFNYLVNTTKNRHAMESHTLGENHKTEWNRALRKIARENERQQMLKGARGGKPKLIQLPSECCSESVVPVVKLFNIPLLLPFQNEE